MEQYKTCESAEAVSAMQEKILADLEKSYDESRRTSGEFPSLTHRQNPNPSLPFAHPAFCASRAENVLCMPRRWQSSFQQRDDVGGGGGMC